MRRPKCFGCAGSSICDFPTHSCSHLSSCIKKSEFGTFQRVFGELSDKCASIVQTIAELMINHPHVPSESIGIPLESIPPETIHFSGFTIQDGNLRINISGYESEDSQSSVVGCVEFPIDDIIANDQWHVEYIEEVTEDIESNIQEHELDMLKRLKEKYEDND